MMKRTTLVFLSLSLALSVQARAAWDLDHDAFELPAPPRTGSAAERRDFEILARYQAERTEAECREAGVQAIPSMKALFGPRTRVLDADEIELVSDLGREVLETVSNAAEPFKHQWRRKRPYDVSEEVEPCIRKPGGQTSYPSGHAAAGVVLGEVFGRIFPAKKAALRRQGLRIGELRVLGGVHHPSDIVAGRRLGRQVLSQLLRNEEFLRDLKRLTR